METARGSVEVVLGVGEVVVLVILGVVLGLGVLVDRSSRSVSVVVAGITCLLHISVYPELVQEKKVTHNVAVVSTPSMGSSVTNSMIVSPSL